MNFDKYTQTSANVINASSDLARTYENAQINTYILNKIINTKNLFKLEILNNFFIFNLHLK